MGAYTFQKLYADVVAPDGTVCITYASWLSVLGRTLFLGGVEVYDPAGGRYVERARRGDLLTSAPSNGSDATSSGDLTVRLSLPSGPFALTLRSGWHTPLPDFPLPGLTWAVHAPRAEATARWSDREPLAGTGYADWVTLDRATRRYPLQMLEWGRVHLEDETALFTRLTLRTGRTWERGLIVGRPSEAPGAWQSDRVRTRWYDGVLGVAAGRDEIAAYHLRPVRCLHDGAPNDPERFPRRWERALIGVLTGSSHETRWLSRATASGDTSRAGWAVHKEVRFGRAAAPVGRAPARGITEPVRLIDPVVFAYQG
jgi:hypothetical protein